MCNNLTKKNLLILLIILVTFSCKKSNEYDFTNYKYYREYLKSDLDENSYKIKGVYIGKKDTFLFNEIFYKNDIIDTARSTFYELKYKKIDNHYVGVLQYNYDSIKDGRLIYLGLNIFNHLKDKNEIFEFEIENNNVLEFNFKKSDDTIMGMVNVRHYKDTIVDGKSMLRHREMYIPIDNYDKTNNPFIGLKVD